MVRNGANQVSLPHQEPSMKVLVTGANGFVGRSFCISSSQALGETKLTLPFMSVLVREEPA
jgi:hypothetical protein